MRFKNELIVIALILFILISISAVSAENNQTEIITINNNVDNNINNEILNDENDGSFADLNRTIAESTSTEIELTNDYAYSTSDSITDGIVINQNNFVIDGKCHTIDANGKSRIFHVNSTNVTLKNIKFINGFHRSVGGAVYNYGENLRVINCTFENNHVKYDSEEHGAWGGAIYSYPDSYSRFTDCTFINNTADYGGAVLVREEDYFRHDIINCVFINNTARIEGGAIEGYGPYNSYEYIRGCLFINNTAPTGSAYCNLMTSKVNITDSIFIDNSQTAVDSYTGNVVANNNWWGNSADDVSLKPDVASVIQIENWLYFDLHIDVASSIATVSINNIYNTTSGKTGKYSTTRLPSITSKIEGVNASFASDSIILDNSGQASAHYDLYGDCEITASYGDISVSKKFNSGSFKELQDLIHNCEDGDVLVLDKDYVYTLGVDKSIIGIEINKAITIDGNGHFVNAAGKSRVFYIDTHRVTLKNIIITNGNATYDDGAGVKSAGNQVNFINCTFVNNTADGATGGGALFISGAYNSVIDCTFTNNIHDYILGGAIYWGGRNATIMNTLFDSNYARTRAGALYLQHGGASIVNCTFINNSAEYAGALYDLCYEDLESTVSNCRFISNSALSIDQTYGGGAIYSNHLLITDSIFSYNYAKTGAALFAVSSKNTVDRCIFINNTAEPLGVIFWENGGTVMNSIFLNNTYSGNIIASPFEGIVADYNWFGQTWKDYTKTPDVTSLATIDHWLFLNITDMLYDEDNNSLDLAYDFFVYDSINKEFVKYDYINLPSINLKLSSQNLTLEKDVVNIAENVNAVVTYYKGEIVAQYENIRYTYPFKFQKDSWIEVNSTIEVEVTKTKSIGAYIRPFENDYQPFIKSRITYQSSNSSIVTVDNDGKIKGVKVGLANVTIRYNGYTAMGLDMYKPSSIVVLVNVTRINTYFEFITKPDSVNVGETVQVIPTLKPSSGYYTYESNDTSIAYATSGLIKGVSEGLANITVVYAGNDKYEPCSASFIINVTKKSTTITLSDNELEIDKGRNYLIAVTLRPSNAGLVECISNDTDVAIYENGIIYGLNTGTANITFYYAGNDKYASSSASIIVTVVDYDTYFEVKPLINVNVTDDAYVHPILRDSNGNQLTVPPIYILYASNDTSVATVDENGRIVGIGEGKANITVTYTGHDKYNPTSASLIVEVSTVKTEITVVSEVELEIGSSVNVNATLNNGKSREIKYTSNDTSVVTVSSRGYLTGQHEGFAKITLTYEGDEKFLPSNATVIVKVTKIPTAIEVGKTFSLLIGDEENLNATLTPITGTLTYESNDTSVVTVDKKGNLKAIRVGIAKITIKYAGTYKYTNATETVTVNVYDDSIPTGIDVNDSIELYAGDVTDIGAVLDPSNAGKLVYTSNDTEVVVIDENGQITAIGEGIANITITLQTNDDKFHKANASVIVTVSAVPTSIEATSQSVNLTENRTVEYVFSHPEAGEIEFIIADPSIISIENGVVIGKKLGETTLTIKFNGNRQYTASSKTITIAVVDVEVTIDAPVSIDVNLTETADIGASLSPQEAGSVSYLSLNESVVSVDLNGVVTGVGVGEADVLITFEANGKYRTATKTVHVIVSDVEVTIDAPVSIAVNLTETGNIGASLSPGEAGSVSYLSLNESVVSVDLNGVVTGIGIGEADVLITFNAQGKYRQATKTVHVVVSLIKSEIEVSSDEISVYIDDNVNINATLKPKADGKLTYISNDTSIVSVDENGEITAVKQGSAQITITYAGEGKYSQATKVITVNVSRIPTEIKINSELTAEIGLGFKINPILMPDNKIGELKLTVNDTNILEIDNTGFIFTLSFGVALINVKFEGNEKYLPSESNITVTVNPRITGIVADDIEIGYGDSKNINAKLIHIINEENTQNMEGKLIYVSDNPDIASIDENGVITANAKGVAKIKITYEGTNIYYPSNKTITVNVTEMVTEITVDQSKLSLKVDDSQTIHATLNRPDDGVLTYKSNNESVATVDENGNITAVGAGNAIITVSYAGNDNYHSSQANVSVSVTKIASTIRVNNTFEILIDENHDLAARLSHDGKLIYHSSHEDIVSVDENGIITGHKAGSAMITITWETDRKYEHAQRFVTVTVNKIPTSIKYDPISIYVNEHYQVENAINPAGAGALSFMSNDWDILGVDETGLIFAYMEGSTYLTVTFEGNDKYLPSETNVTVTVIKKTIPAGDVQFSITERDELNQATFSIKLPDYAEGIFSVVIDGDIYASPIIDGVASKTVEGLTPGNHEVTMRYSGDANYAGITNNTRIHLAEIRIDKNTDVSILSTTTGKYSVHLTGDTQALVGKTVTFTLNGKTITAVTDDLGFATIKVSLPMKSKKYTVTAQYGNVKVSNKITVKSLIVAKNIKVKKSKSSTKIKVSLKKVNGKYLKGKKLILKFKGKKYKAKTNKKGVAKFTLKKKVFAKLKVGKKYKYTVSYSKDTVSKKFIIKK